MTNWIFKSLLLKQGFKQIDTFQSIKDIILNMLKLSHLWPMRTSLSWLQNPSDITLAVFKSFFPSPYEYEKIY